MRWVFYLLLAANVVFGGFLYLRESAPNPDAQIIGLQMNADQVNVLPAPTPAAEPAVVEKRATACLQWGGFAATDLPRAQAVLDRLAIGERARRIEVGVTTSYWVHIPPLASKPAMDRKTSELKALGVDDYSPILEPGRWRYAISLGLFRSEEGARKYLAQLRGKGVRSAIVGEREQRAMQAAFLVIEPTEEESARLVELSAELPGSEIRAVECPAR
jgi:cell division septation protein DedD